MALAAGAAITWAIVAYFNTPQAYAPSAPWRYALALLPLALSGLVARAVAMRFRAGYTASTFIAATTAAFPYIRLDRFAGLPPGILRGSQLFDRAATSYVSDCLFTGDVQGVPISFAFVQAAAGASPIFEGVLFQAEFVANVPHAILCGGPRTFSAAQLRGRVRVEMAELTRGFALAATDEGLARAAVTPLMALYLDDLARNMRGRPLRASFVANRFIVAIAQTRGLARPGLWDLTSDLDNVLGVAEQVRGFARIVTAMRRNPALWKQARRRQS